jgi:hypothetical protein
MAALLATSACSDADTTAVNTPSGPSLLYKVVDEGEPTYYESSYTLSGSGGLPGWDNTAERHARTLTEIDRWSSYEGIWTVDNRFSSPETPIEGYPQSSDLEVSRGYKARSSLSATAQNGAALSISSTPPIDQLPAADGPAYSVASNSLRALRSQASAAPQRPAPPAAEVQSAGADRGVVTPRGKARELARLRAQFTESQAEGGDLEFHRVHRGSEVRIRFNPGIGAVTRITRLTNGRKVTETDRFFRREGEGWVISRVVIQSFDENGRPAGRTTQEVSHVQVR